MWLWDRGPPPELQNSTGTYLVRKEPYLECIFVEWPRPGKTKNGFQVNKDLHNCLKVLLHKNNDKIYDIEIKMEIFHKLSLGLSVTMGMETLVSSWAGPLILGLSSQLEGP